MAIRFRPASRHSRALVTGDELTPEGTDTEPTEHTGEAPQAEPQNTGPQTSAEWCEWLGLDETAVALAAAHAQPQELVTACRQQQQFESALCLTAALLPKPEAVSWAANCVRNCGKQSNPILNQALDAGLQWAQEPSEATRRAAERAAAASQFQAAESWIALAAFWSDGSIAPEDQPAVPAPPQLTARAITGALMMAATSGNPGDAEQRYLRFLDQAEHLLAEPASV